MNDTSSEHRQAWDLIPWIVNGSAPDSQRLLVQSHLDACADCRQELEFQRQLQAAMVLPGTRTAELDVEASWQRLQSRLDLTLKPPAEARVPQRSLGAARGWMPWLVAAIVVQALGLGALGAAWWSRPRSSASLPAASAVAYRTLSAPEAVAPAATIRVVFAPELTLGQLQSMLSGIRLQVRAGPSDAGVWTLGPAGDSNHAATDTALRELRARTGVRFAETIAGAP